MAQGMYETTNHPNEETPRVQSALRYYIADMAAIDTVRNGVIYASLSPNKRGGLLMWKPACDSFTQIS